MSLADELWSQGRPIGYVSFLTALVHHGVVVDGVATIQVASLDRAGDWETGGTPIEFHLIPRDLWLGHQTESQPFEGERLPVATPEKALLDWCWLAEEEGVDPRLDEVDWSLLDRDRLDALAAETGVSYRSLLPPPGASHHDQDRLRADEIERLR
jgi:hypothetical protein